MQKAAKKTTLQYFGRTIGLYAPLYISNYCDNLCVYCGFNSGEKLERRKLTHDEIKKECAAIAKTGIQNILILTGESRTQAPVSYIKDAVLTAKKYFSNISLEIYPLETQEYRELYEAGADGIVIYQETYDRIRYQELHLYGKKTDYDFRYGAPERIAKAGMRQISLGVLLGLSDWKEDIKALFDHLKYLESKYPGVEYSLSFPRLKPINGDDSNYFIVSDHDMLNIICSARINFPRVGINLSTRERAEFRDSILGYGITKMSAGSITSVGGYSILDKNQECQFSVSDNRSVSQIKSMLKDKGFDPVLTDWRSIVNE